jgi:hypothetical protein
MSRLLSIATALAAILLTGLAHGVWTDRWKISRDLEDAVARIAQIPESVGDWHGQPLELDRQMLKVAEVDGYFARRFRNRSNGGEITVLLVCGRPGPIARHTPDVCYQGLGYATAGAPTIGRIAYGSGLQAGAWSAKFWRVNAAVRDGLEIFWSWNAFGTWEAPDNERVRFAPSRFLYKLYVIRPIDTSDGQGDDDACRGFLREFLPGLDAALVRRAAESGSPLRAIVARR